MTIVHSLSLIGVQAYGSAQAARPAAQPKDHPVERFQVEDIVDTSDKRAAAVKRAQEEARETQAAKRQEQSE